MRGGDNLNAQLAISACFAVTPGAPFSFGGKYASGDESLSYMTSEANLSCSVFGSDNCTPGGAVNWFTSPEVNFGSNDTGFKSFSEVSGTIDGFARSASCGVAMSTTYVDFSGGPSGINIDNIYFNSIPPTAPGIKLGGYMSGNWYDPTQSGHGFLLEFTAQANTLIAAWFVYAPDGSGDQRWIYAQGAYDTSKNVVTIPAALAE